MASEFSLCWALLRRRAPWEIDFMMEGLRRVLLECQVLRAGPHRLSPGFVVFLGPGPMPGDLEIDFQVT